MFCFGISHTHGVCHLPAHTCHSVKSVEEQPEHNEKPWIKKIENESRWPLELKDEAITG